MTDRVALSQYLLNDGRLAPLEPDLVCRSLFAATERSGRPDAFLARELTDGIVFFLSEEVGGSTHTVGELSELIIKCVRELGHPMLAQRLAEHTDSLLALVLSAPTANTSVAAEKFTGLEDVSLTSVFPRDVVSVHRDGLLTLTGLAQPFQLAGSALGQGTGEEIAAAHEHTGGYVAIDGPEFGLAALSGDCATLAKAYVSELQTGLSNANLHAVVNLNQSDPPAWAARWRKGPLFVSLGNSPDTARLQEMAQALARVLLVGNVDVFWHLSGPDLQPENLPRLLEVNRLGAHNSRLTFVLDRSRYPQSLAPGLSRQKPVVLMSVGVEMNRLAQQISPLTPDRFLGKLGTLARLARSAGHAKFDFLRQHGGPQLTRRFLLDRARLVVVPIGLETVVRSVIGKPLSDGDTGTEFAKAIVASLKDALTTESPRNMEACLDEVPITHAPLAGAGLTPSDPDSTPRQQIKAAGALHAIAGSGTAVVRISPEAAPSPEDFAGFLRQAWHQTEVHRIKFRVD